MEEYINQIKYIGGFMNYNDAISVSNYAKNHLDSFTDFGNTEQEFKVHTYNEILENDKEILKIIQDVAKRVYKFVISEYSVNFENFIEEKTHIAKFEKGRGMHEHYDASRPLDIATLVYLNDEYEGGDIYFPKYKISYKPKPGDLLCFPDNPNFIHGVKPIIDGTRFTLPRWFTRKI